MKESSKKNSPRKNETEGNLVSALGVRDLEKPDTTGQLLEIIWRPQGDSNPCRRRERPISGPLYLLDFFVFKGAPDA